jgi:D-cysteine desulfhydrase
MIGATTETDASLPLLRRFPTLSALPRAQLGHYPTPVERIDQVAPGLWVKREDLTAEPLGGNKVRALEFFLGGLNAGEALTTVGAVGSTHVLATAVYGSQLGARPIVYRWRQEMNAAARRVADRIAATAADAPIVHGVAMAYARAWFARLGGARWIPAGGSSPLGILGQVNAGLEVASQVTAGVLPAPDRIVVPLGSGGTLAGLAIGFGIAQFETQLIGVRVVPRIVANRLRIRRLLAGTTRLIERITSKRLSPPDMRRVEIRSDFFGGAYGRETPAGSEAARQFTERTGIAIDATYGAKALAAALALCRERRGTTLFWLSFDSRWLRGGK